MDQAVTDDFVLHTYARGLSPDMEFVSKKLTVKQNVAFYTSRFQGKLFGLIAVDFTPESLPPPIPPFVPIIFTDATIQLVWVTSGVLTGTPNLDARPV
jgi:hypothetical protein